MSLKDSQLKRRAMRCDEHRKQKKKNDAFFSSATNYIIKFVGLKQERKYGAKPRNVEGEGPFHPSL